MPSCPGDRAGDLFRLDPGSGVIIESIFNYPGIGSLIFAAINSKDYFVINGTVAIMSCAPPRRC